MKDELRNVFNLSFIIKIRALADARTSAFVSRKYRAESDKL